MAKGKKNKNKNRTRRSLPAEKAPLPEWLSAVCLACGRCCIHSPIPILDDAEAEKLWVSHGSPHSFKDFQAEHLCLIDWDASGDIPENEVFKGKNGNRPKYLMMGSDGKCPFLGGSRGQYQCSVYSSRPEACSSFDCLPIMWFRKFLVTGVLTYTTRPESMLSAHDTVTRCIEDTNAMMNNPEGGNFDPRRFIKEKTFIPQIDKWKDETPKTKELRTTEYLHELPRHTETETTENTDD